jgi:hypothetical protein
MKNYFTFIPVILLGYVIVILRLLGTIANIWLEKKTIIKVLTLLLLMQFIFSARQWFYYEISFTDVKEVLGVSSKSNLYFIITTLVCLVLSFKEEKILNLTVIILLLLQAVLFLFGESKPNWIHIDFALKTDYHTTYSYISYAVLLVANTIISIFKLI